MAATTSADLSPAIIAHAQRAVLDWLGSVMAGALEPPARMAQRVAAGLGRSDDAMMFAGGRASAAAAAFANGVASHILELDDIHKGSTVHAAAPIVPAALAVAEREHATGRAFLTAVVLGYEAAFRVGEAVNPSHYRFWHPTGTAATFGAAAAAGSLVRLDAEQMLHALGSAGTQAAGLWEFNADGSMSKHLHPGQSGVERGALGRSRAGGLYRRDPYPRRRSRILPGDEHRLRCGARDRGPGHDLEDRGERLQAALVLRPYAHRDRRDPRSASSTRMVGGAGARRGRVDRHRDLRSRLRDRQGDESAVRHTRRSSASPTAWPWHCRRVASALRSSRPIASVPTACVCRRSRRCWRGRASGSSTSSRADTRRHGRRT